MLRKLQNVGDYYLITPIIIAMSHMIIFQKNYYIQHLDRFFIFIIIYLSLLTVVIKIKSKFFKIIISSFLVIVTNLLATIILGYGDIFQNRSLYFFLEVIPFIWIKSGGHFVFFVMIIIEMIFFSLSWLCDKV